jgi:hypothetical protein
MALSKIEPVVDSGDVTRQGGTELQVWRIVDDELITEQPTQVIAFLFGADAFGAVSRSIGRRASRRKP